MWNAKPLCLALVTLMAVGLPWGRCCMTGCDEGGSAGAAVVVQDSLAETWPACHGEPGPGEPGEPGTADPCHGPGPADCSCQPQLTSCDGASVTETRLAWSGEWRVPTLGDAVLVPASVLPTSFVDGAGVVRRFLRDRAVAARASLSLVALSCQLTL